MRYLFLLVLFFTASYPDSLEQEDNIEKVLEAIYEKKENFSQDNFYEETLEKAYYAYLEKDYKRAIQKLDLIFSKYNEKDWRYFAIRAKTHEALEQEDEAINHYTFSIALNPAQPDIFKKLYELNFKIRRPVKSFDYLRLYLSQNEKDIHLRYRALILAKRLGNEEYASYALKKIQSQNTFSEDKKKILENIKSLITKKKFKQAKEESQKYLPYFPLEEELHNNLQIAQRNLNSKGKEMESALIDTAVLFSDNPKYSLRLALFYKEKKFYWKALDLFRRVFYTSFAKEGFELDTEILLFLKECYFQLNKSNDVRACISLIEIFSASEKPDLAEWNSLRINFNNNREFLISILYYAKTKKLNSEYEKFKEILRDRDEKKSDLELMNTYSIFIFDDFRNTIP
jgi:tetratricopeptide (TPR) repeat protein